MAGGTGTVGAWRLEMGRFTTALLLLYYCFTTASLLLYYYCFTTGFFPFTYRYSGSVASRNGPRGLILFDDGDRRRFRLQQ